MSPRPTPPRGTRDLLPAEVLQRRHLLERIVSVYESFGFQQIETPAFEEIERLLGSEAGENEKLIYKILRRGITDWPTSTQGDAVDLGLRYDLTVPLARFYATHSAELLTPFKAIQTGPVWRAERPQKGRYRQFVQCDIDVIGDPTELAEIELIAGGTKALAACGLSGFTVRINDRRILRSLVNAVGFDETAEPCVLVALDKLDKVGIDGVREQLSDIDNNGAASSKLGELLPVLQTARGADAVSDNLPNVDTKVIEGLNAIVSGVRTALNDNVKLVVDPTLVRGQGYYTGPIFEVEYAGAPGAVAGGGRYDKMIAKLSGIDVPASGISIGFERVWDLLGESLNRNDQQRVALLYSNGSDMSVVMAMANELRETNAVVRIERSVKNRNAQLTRLASAGFTHWGQHVNDGNVELQELTATTK